MDRKELFLKYIDDELSENERKAMDELLASDQQAREEMKDLKTARETMLLALEKLNPIDSVQIPDFKRQRTFNLFHSIPFRIAAAVVLLFGVAYALWMIGMNNTKKEDEVVMVDITDIQQEYEDLDCYISPNRCWHERKIPLIIIKIK
ncbi:MAG: hypothetical protein KQI35_11475 [Bacteroidetes bacterium]|nr:hypothetical protein [Bacteroidota bacterium]